MGLLVILVVSVLWTGPSLALPQSQSQSLDIDSSQLPQQDINTLNCFDLVEESQWNSVLDLNLSTASLSVSVSAAPPVVTCLTRQTVSYLVSVVGDTNTTQFLLADFHQWEGESSQLVSSPPTFPYLIYGGRYRLRLTQCGQASGGQSCGQETGTRTVFSQFVNLAASEDTDCSQTNTSTLPPALSGNVAVFQFSFTPCSPVQHYDRANVSLYSAEREDQCGTSQPLLSSVVSVSSDSEGQAGLSYQSPQLQAERFYCLSVSVAHISCRLAARQAPDFCFLQSESVWVGAVPASSFLLPLCTDHLSCAWLYIVIGAGSVLLLSCFLAVVCIRCCDYCRDRRQEKRDEVDFSGEVISLAPVHDRISWAELHKEWESREDKPRGKILLLFSPDTKLFKELQEAFKSFLDLACHCDIYDLFDDALFDTIALDPSEWLQEFVNDEEVKILVISSAGAHRRQLALRGEQPLNLPDNSLLDGLFTSGLRFVSTFPGLASSGRVATARYEMLQLTEESHKLGPPLSGPNSREFLVPTQLHELFCWVHHLKPLDLIGKPWANYHLEMQLLQDALKLVRRDRTVMSSSSNPTQANFQDVGNGITMI